jgi:hypothetical protein
MIDIRTRRRVYDQEGQLPTVAKTSFGYRVFVSKRIHGKSHIFFLEFDHNLKLTYESPVPVLHPGDRGRFDDQGVMPSCLVGSSLYYTGWNTDKGDVPYGHGIGIADWDEPSQSLKRRFEGPLVDRCVSVPFLANSPCVTQADEKWEMIFCNGRGWEMNFPVYGLTRLTSTDPAFSCNRNFEDIVWPAGTACSRATKIHDSILFAMKKRNEFYQIFSLQNQELKLILQKSNSTWESEMVCYPYYCDGFIFYNGNGYGKSGIGVVECLKN